MARYGTDKGFRDEQYRSLIGSLVDARVTLGLSQSALAKQIGVAQQFVSRYETGERRLDVVEFVAVARALRLDPHVLIGDVG